MKAIFWMIPAVLAVILTQGLLLADESSAQVNQEPGRKIKLVFSMDQGFGNGIVVNNDQVAVKRIVTALRPLRKKYDVYLLVNPLVADKTKLENVLDALQKYDMPFVMDIITSDSMALGSLSPTFIKPYDIYHGITISYQQLDKYKKRYGKYLAGLRFMEVFGADFSVRATRLPDPPDWAKWFAEHYKLPKDDFFQPKLAEPFFKFAMENRMFIQWSEFHWTEFATWDDVQIEDEAQLSELIRKYPGVVTVVYDNNEPLEESVKRLPYWEKAVKKFEKDGAAFGLSDQTWMRADFNNCPVSEIIAWAESAIKRGSRYIQFEPVWYHFKMPVAVTELQDYTTDPKWADRGKPTDNFYTLREFLLNYSL